MNILVAFASQRGGTAGIAHAIGDEMRLAGHHVEVRPAKEVESIDRYDAVLVGAALYYFRWHHDARAFVLRHTRALREKPVWFFDSGPIDNSATQGVLPPLPFVRRLMRHVGARGHATFGGRLDAKDPSPLARTMNGDFRDFVQIRAWAKSIAMQLEDSPMPIGPSIEPLPSRVWPLTLELTVGIPAVIGGALLLARPSGALLGLSPDLLVHTPFHGYAFPAVLLLVGVGGSHLFAAYLHAVYSDIAEMALGAAGIVLLVWTATQMILLRSAEPMQVLYLGLGLGIVTRARQEIRALLPPMPKPPERRVPR